MTIHNDPVAKIQALPPELFSITADFLGYAPDTLEKLFPEAQQLIQHDEFNKNRLQLIADLEGRQIDLASGGYPVAALLKKYNIPQKRTADGKPKLPSLDLQVKVLYRYYKERISEIDPSNKYHLSLDDLPRLIAYDKAFNKVQLWKQLPGGSIYLDSDQMRMLSLPEQASQLKAWIESFPAVINSVIYLSLQNLKLTSIPEEIGLLTNLISLKLDNNQIGKIENLDSLTKLSDLYLNNNQISKIENLNALTQLENLNLCDNQINKIENLDVLTQLQFLYLGNNQISKIENLDRLTGLRYLTLFNNPIIKIENPVTLNQFEAPFCRLYPNRFVVLI